MPSVSARLDAARRAGTRDRHLAQPRRKRRLLVEPLEHRWLLAGQSLFYAGIDDAAVSPTNAGLILAADLDSGRQMPLAAQVPLSNEGISGMAFLSSGELYGSTSAPGSTSDLIRLDPATGEELSRVPINAAGPISIGDLAVQPDSNVIYVVRSADDGGGGAGEIYTIDTSGAATLIGRANVGVAVDGGLAFAPDGTLFYTTAGTLSAAPVLHALDPQTATILSTIPLTGSTGFNIGLAYWTEGATLVASGAPNGEIVAIDADTGARTPIALDAPARGILGDLDFLPTSLTLEQVHRASFETGTEGYTADNTGRMTPGLWHYSLGRSADGLLNHSPTHAWYYGIFETTTGGGRYPVNREHRGVLISPEIDLPASGATILSFSYLLETRPELTHDFVTVSIEQDGTITEILSRADGTLPQTGRDKWLTSTADISEFNGQTIRVRFSFDTGMGPVIDPEGWYVDDVQISNLDRPGGSIAWEKRDTGGNLVSVAGATFSVAPDPLPGGEGTFTVVDNGANDLDPAIGAIRIDAAVDITYTVTETVPPAGYLIDPNPSRMAMPTSESPDAVIGTPGVDDDDDFHNRLIGSVAWEKRDTGGNVVSVAGAAFTVTPDPLPDGAGTFTVIDNGANDLDPAIGAIRIDAAVDVLYTVTETAPPAGYLIDPNPSRMAMPTSETPNAVIGTPGVDDEDDFHNRLIGSIAWEKRDTGGSFVGNAGATFTVIPDPLPGGGGAFAVVDNGANDLDPAIGMIRIDAAVDITYTITETVPPAGYLLEPDPSRTATPTSETPNVEIGTPGVDDEDDFHNRLIGSIAWEKRDTGGNFVSVAGATFTVTPDPLPGGAGTFTVVDNGTNDLDPAVGMIRIDAAVDITYTVTETVPPPGHLLDPDPSRTATPTSEMPNAAIGAPGVDDENDFHNELLAPSQTIQFITPLSVFRLDGPFTTGDDKPPEGDAAIVGFKWHDVNQNGQWDAGEPGRQGWTIFIDDNGDGILDPQTERFAITEADGKYMLSGLAAGTYTVLEDGAGLSDGTFSVHTFPAANELGRHTHVVTVAAGETFEGDFGVAEPPNFGGFEYSPFVRPADDMLGRLRVADSESLATRLSALGPWQMISINNPTGATIEITEIVKDIDQSIPVADEFVTVTDADLDEIVFPLAIGPGATVELFAFYDPAIRSGDTVLAQYPDWFDDPDTPEDESSTRPAHTFVAGDRLEFVTDGGFSYEVFLVGGSTYDSDIFYDASVNLADFLRLDSFLNVEWPTIEGVHPQFEPTSDVNARFPNGADGSLASGSWPLDGMPPREFGLGDFGPLNVEFGRARAPFLDLDGDNSSGVRGTDYFATVAAADAAIGVRVVDFDARFANALALNLVSMEIRIAAPPDGQNEGFSFDTTGTNITGVSQFVGDARVLTLSGDDTVANYANVLATVEYLNSAGSITAGPRTIATVATGGSDFTALNDVSERIGNRAIATLVIEETVPMGVAQAVASTAGTIEAAESSGDAPTAPAVEPAFNAPQASDAAGVEMAARGAAPVAAMPAPATVPIAAASPVLPLVTTTTVSASSNAAPAHRAAAGSSDAQPTAGRATASSKSALSGVQAAWWSANQLPIGSDVEADERPGAALPESPVGDETVPESPHVARSPSGQSKALPSGEEADSVDPLELAFAEWERDDLLRSLFP